MKGLRYLLSLSLIALSFVSNSQEIAKKALTTNDFAKWKVVVNPIVSSDGKYISFEVNPQKGDGSLILKTQDNKKEEVLPRAYGASFASESDFIVYKIKQPVDSVRLAKKKKVKKELMPKDSVGVLFLKKHKIYKFPNLKRYSLPKENASWVALLTDMKKPAKKTDAENDKKKPAAKKTDLPDDQKGQLILLNPESGDTVNFQNVSDYYFAQQGGSVSFIRQTKDSVDRTEVLVFDTKTRRVSSIFRQSGTAKKIASDKMGGRFGFVFSADTAKTKVYGLYLATAVSTEAKLVVSPSQQGLPIGWSPSEFGDLSFSDNGLHLYFGTNEIPRTEPKDSLLDDEKPVLDIWTWQDRDLQPEQKINLEKEKKRTYKAVYLIDKEKVVQLANPEIRDVTTTEKGNGHLALGADRTPYKLASSWTGRSNADYYLIEIETGARRLIVKDKPMARLSPGGNYVVWFDSADSTYYALSTVNEEAKMIPLNKQTNVSFCDELWDMPGEPNYYGIAGFAENDKYVFINDRFDIWRFDMEGVKVPVNATKSYGRKNALRLRYIKLDQDEDFIDTSKPVLLSGFDETNKSAGYFNADFRNYADPRLLLMEDKMFGELSKAKSADVVVYTREDVDEAPNVWTSSASFDNRRKLSDVNPEQSKFVWPKVHLVHWDTFAGKKMEGMLYFPDNIDQGKKYPMIVYFYERNADNLHVYTEPSPTRSTVNRTFYTSNEYIVFVPDITYETGDPGRSAFDAVVSGTQFVSSMYPFIDRKRIGIQGQSWGGYQTAWLITQTEMFAAAMAGAPVANMTSAYGGIRWESGLSREYQYEVSQSRIGGTLWDKPMNYIENSPLFYVPKIKTPLLIMHNDADGAVPWYQGIELFTAMRRLSKPVWMLTYNNEEHNLKADSWANRMDLTIRMKQFFDYYLKDGSMPSWMKNGIPAIQKGKEMGY